LVSDNGQLLVESDRLRAVQAFSLETPDNSHSWALILEGHELLRVYRDLGVSKVERASNNVAQLGKAGYSGSLSLDAPDRIKELVSSEMM
jgi:hypothetical protein